MVLATLYYVQCSFSFEQIDSDKISTSKEEMLIVKE